MDVSHSFSIPRTETDALFGADGLKMSQGAYQSTKAIDVPVTAANKSSARVQVRHWIQNQSRVDSFDGNVTSDHSGDILVYLSDSRRTAKTPENFQADEALLELERLTHTNTSPEFTSPIRDIVFSALDTNSVDPAESIIDFGFAEEDVVSTGDLNTVEELENFSSISSYSIMGGMNDCPSVSDASSDTYMDNSDSASTDAETAAEEAEHQMAIDFLLEELKDWTLGENSEELTAEFSKPALPSGAFSRMDTPTPHSITFPPSHEDPRTVSPAFSNYSESTESPPNTPSMFSYPTSSSDATSIHSASPCHSRSTSAAQTEHAHVQSSSTPSLLLGAREEQQIERAAPTPAPAPVPLIRRRLRAATVPRPQKFILNADNVRLDTDSLSNVVHVLETKAPAAEFFVFPPPLSAASSMSYDESSYAPSPATTECFSDETEQHPSRPSISMPASPISTPLRAKSPVLRSRWSMESTIRDVPVSSTAPSTTTTKPKLRLGLLGLRKSSSSSLNGKKSLGKKSSKLWKESMTEPNSPVVDNEVSSIPFGTSIGSSQLPSHPTKVPIPTPTPSIINGKSGHGIGGGGSLLDMLALPAQLSFTRLRRFSMQPDASGESTRGFSVKAPKKKLLVRGVAIDDMDAFDAVRGWCESHGHVRNIKRASNGDIHVSYKDRAVADAVCKLNARASIRGVGSVYIEGYEGKGPF